MTALIDNEVIAATANTFSIAQREQALTNLRLLAQQRKNPLLSQLAQAFELNQAGSVAQAAAIFKKLYDADLNLNDRTHLGTKLGCSTAVLLTQKTRFSSIVQTGKALEQPCHDSVTLEKYRRTHYNNLVAQAINQPTFHSQNAVYNTLATLEISNLNEEVSPTTFVYAAIAALNPNELDRQVSIGDNQQRLLAFANILEKFGKNFPRGYLIYIRELIKANEFEQAQKVLSHPVLMQHAKDNTALAEIISFTHKTITALQQASSQDQAAILKTFLDTNGDPLGQPFMSLTSPSSHLQHTATIC